MSPWEKSPSKYVIAHYFPLVMPCSYDYRLGNCVSGELLVGGSSSKTALSVRAVRHQGERRSSKDSGSGLKASGSIPSCSAAPGLIPCTTNVHRAHGCLVGLRRTVWTDGRGWESEGWHSHPLLKGPSLLPYSGSLKEVPEMLSGLFKVKQLASSMNRVSGMPPDFRVPGLLQVQEIGRIGWFLSQSSWLGIREENVALVMKMERGLAQSRENFVSVILWKNYIKQILFWLSTDFHISTFPLHNYLLQRSPFQTEHFLPACTVRQQNWLSL